MHTTTTEAEITDDSAISRRTGEIHMAEPTTAQPKKGEEKRKRLVSLLRGYFASPVIATLGEVGLAERMMAGEFAEADWANAPRPDLVVALLRYLHSVGLITKAASGSYVLTAEGRTAIARNGAFSLLMSYADYFHQLPGLLSGGDLKPTVNRLRNVRGSSQLHGKKFFPSAFDFLSDAPPLALIDIGCGDGHFLQHAREKWPDLSIFGVDLSEAAVETTKQRLSAIGGADSAAVAADGYDVVSWSASAPEHIRKSSGLVISLWFVAHEFSKSSPERMSLFFKTLKQIFPQATIVLGEINKISPDRLVKDHELSIMPEFLLFHELSGQGVLSWTEWRHILNEIPYTLKDEKTFDEVGSIGEALIPASFIWHLKPR
jgi:SAM-dependent methyltransferase